MNKRDPIASAAPEAGVDARHPWRWFLLVGAFLAVSLALLRFARPQDAAKITLWWFALGGGLLAASHQISGRLASRVWLILCLVFGLDGAVQGVVRDFFGSQPQPGVLAEAVANTSAGEAWGFVLAQWRQITLGSAYWLAWWLLGWRGRIAWQGHAAPARGRLRLLVPALLLVLAAALHANPTMLRSEPFLRWGVLYVRHQQERAQMQQLLLEREARWAERAQWRAELVDPRPRTVVLFIGESGNRMNWGLYGYPRDTTAPLAQAFAELGGQTLLFSQVRSTHAFTLPSLRMALTPANEAEPELWRSAPDLVQLARAVGYRVLWISNQPGGDGWIASLGHGADEHVFINKGNWRDSSSEDEDLVPVLRRYLQQPAPPHELIVIHLLGQHFHYALRCGSRRGPFAEADDDAVARGLRAQGRAASTLQARNDYDDATWCGARSVAQLLRSVAQAREGRAVDALYFSDHGQEVGHFRDFAGHSEQDESGYAVPLWVWRNARAEPLPTDHLAAPIRLDVLDQAVQHLLGMRSRWYDPGQDFLAPEYRAGAAAD